MRVVILDTPDDVAKSGSELIIGQTKQLAGSVIGLATGSTPLALYNKLVLAYQENRVSFADVTSFNLDEYLGLEAGHGQSYRYYMQDNLFDHIDIKAAATHVPNGATDDPHQACRDYEAEISKSGGIDLQLLGIGRNGHIGFNEPSSSLASRTRVKALTQATIEDNARFFTAGEFQPSLSLTMGIGSIMQARKIILIATGESKADAISKMIEGSVSASCPASILQMHASVTVLVDEQAASKLHDKEFYKFVEKENIKLNAE
jgi:glucosamine-6-phosphate deaminase